MATDRRHKAAPRKRAAASSSRSTRTRTTSVTARRAPARKAAKKAAAKKTAVGMRRAKGTKVAKSKLPADLALAVAAALDKKAENLNVLDLRRGGAFTDYFLIATGTNIRQVQAIADGIQESLKKTGQRASLVEGYSRAEWILLDYFDFIVHVFTPATREFYALEKLWGDAEPVNVPAE